MAEFSGIVDQNGVPFSTNGRAPRGRYEDDGYGDFAVPHIATFAQIIGGGDKTYLHNRFDEAIRYSRQSALVMRRDAFLMSLLQEVKLSVVSIPWELSIPDEKDEKQKLVRDTLKLAIEGIADFRRIIYSLLEAIWYGRYAVELEWEWQSFRGKKVLSVVDWFPINGDKLGWNFEGTPYVLVNTTVIQPDPGVKLVNTAAGGRGLLLEGTWRNRFIIHRNEIDDADYFDGEAATGVWGVGIRSRIFWMDWIRREYLEWITTFLERVGLGVTLWYYDGGNAAALQSVQKAAKNQSRRANLFVPVFSDGKGSPKGLVERIETPVNGVDALRMLKEDIEQKIERYVVGQEASSKNSGSKGLGNQAGAEFQKETKHYITDWHANNLAETLTGTKRNPGLVYIMQKYSFPWSMPDQPNGFRVKFKFGKDVEDSEKKLSAIEKVVSFGIPVRADDARNAAGLSKPDIGDEIIQVQQAVTGEGGPGAAVTDRDTDEFQSPYQDADESAEDILGPGAESALAMKRGVTPDQYGSNYEVTKDMLARRNNAAPQIPNKPAPPGWHVYHGPHGGIGWKHGLTGKVIYATSGRSPFKTKGSGKPEAKPKGSAKNAAAFETKRRINSNALAKWYCDHFNLMGELGLQPSEKEKKEAGLELYGSGVSLWHDKDGEGKWQVVPLKDNKQDKPIQYAFNPEQARVPAGQGPISIGGRSFKGGEWVPKEFETMATPAQKKMLHEKQEESTNEKLEKGPVNTGQIRMTVAGHADKELSGDQLRHGKQAYKALMQHHGELLMHRIDELVQDAKAVHDSIPDDAENADELRKKFGERIKAYGHMMDWAKEHGMHPEAEVGHENLEPKEEKPSTPAAPAKPSGGGIAASFAKHEKGHNLVDLADIRDDLAAQGMIREQQDAAIKEALATGEWTGAGYEGRHGITPRQQEAKYKTGDDDEFGMGYLAKKPKDERQRAEQSPAQPSKPEKLNRNQALALAGSLASGTKPETMIARAKENGMTITKEQLAILAKLRSGSGYIDPKKIDGALKELDALNSGSGTMTSTGASESHSVADKAVQEMRAARSNLKEYAAIGRKYLDKLMANDFLGLTGKAKKQAEKERNEAMDRIHMMLRVEA